MNVVIFLRLCPRWTSRLCATPTGQHTPAVASSIGSSSGTAVITTEGTATAGAMIYPAGPGVGVLMDNGIRLDLTLGTYIVYYADAV